MVLVSNVYISDIVTIENITMSVSLGLPLQWKRVNFETKNSSGVLAAATITIAIKDPAGSTRVVYDSDNLSTSATGVYAYDFQIPENIVDGDWHVNISATIGGRTSIKNVHFSVEEV